jgi:hypothetical protein
MDDVGRVDVLQRLQNLVDDVLLVHFLENVAPDDCVQIDLHEFKDEVEVVRVLCSNQTV